MERSESMIGLPFVPAIEWGVGITQHDLVEHIREIEPNWFSAGLGEWSLPVVPMQAGNALTGTEFIEMTDSERIQTSGEDQPWGTSAHGEGEQVQPTGRGAGVGGASMAGTPANTGDRMGSESGELNAEAETSGLRPPEGTADQPKGKTGPTAEPPRGPGAFVDEQTAPPVFDE